MATLPLLLLGSAVIAAAGTASSTPDDGRVPLGPAIADGVARPGAPSPAWADAAVAWQPDAPAPAPTAAALPPELASRPSARPPEAAPQTEPRQPPGRIRARGVATWYCLPGVSACHRDRAGGRYAAAGPALRVGAWRGRLVTACAGDRCVRVRLIDWCGCDGGRTGRVIDLYGDAFARIAPLSRGEVRVTVRW